MTSSDSTTPEPRTRPVTVRLPVDMIAEIAERADEVTWDISTYIRNALQVTLDRLKTSTEPPLADAWKIIEDSGQCGHTYEMHVTFSLPPVGDAGDQMCYEVRDATSRLLTEMGARHPVFRLISLTGMERDRRNASPTPLEAIAAEAFDLDGILEHNLGGRRAR